MLQLARQHKAALEQQRAQSRQQLHKEIHKDIAERLHKVGESVGNLNITAMTLVMSLRLRRDFLDRFGRPYVTGVDYPPERLIREHNEATGDLISILNVLEDYEIALTGLDDMRRRFAQKVADVSPRWGDFYHKVLPFLAINVSAADSKIYLVPEGLHTPVPPMAAQIDEIQKEATELQEVLYDLMGFVFDVRVAAQNHLLAELFPGSIARERQPEDPRIEVLRPIYAAQRPQPRRPPRPE